MRVVCSCCLTTVEMKIAIINGPNLNLVGRREPSIYGSADLAGYLQSLTAAYSDIEFSVFQSNSEGAIIDELQQRGYSADGIILNAGGYTHTSVAIADAVRAIPAPVVEVHISNIQAREDYRHTSLLTGACRGIIAGFGLDGYRLAIEALRHRDDA